MGLKREGRVQYCNFFLYLLEPDEISHIVFEFILRIILPFERAELLCHLWRVSDSHWLSL